MQEFAKEQKTIFEELTEEDEAEIQKKYHGIAFLLGSEKAGWPQSHTPVPITL
jgi:hypothetical protein